MSISAYISVKRSSFGVKGLGSMCLFRSLSHSVCSMGIDVQPEHEKEHCNLLLVDWNGSKIKVEDATFANTVKLILIAKRECYKSQEIDSWCMPKTH